jgi:hypothetical protein
MRMMFLNPCKTQSANVARIGDGDQRPKTLCAMEKRDTFS